MTTTLPAQPANFTRRSKSLVAKFAREGRFHFIPVYWLLRLSFLAREGMDHSGSFRFADHIYAGVPAGRGWLGRQLDRLLLNLPAARAMRQRCLEAREAMRRAFRAHLAAPGAEPFRVLTVPCGLPREVRDFVNAEASANPSALARIEYTGLDLDPAVVDAARHFLAKIAWPEPTLRIGNALDPAAFPSTPSHFISSTGLGEFLDDDALARFYANVYTALAPGGTFFTSATACEPRSDQFLRAFELDTHYRTTEQVRRLMGAQPWKSIELSRDSRGLQTFVRAVKE
jgi:SAM-dependent methyltransferase